MTAKDLKNALLQEAVQGRLVPQDSSEGNARDLLKEIKKNHTDLQILKKSAGKKELPPFTKKPKGENCKSNNLCIFCTSSF